MTQQQRCEMVVGFLIPRHCEKPALGHCLQCGRGYCDEHLSITAEGMICTACTEGHEQALEIPVVGAPQYNEADFAAFEEASLWDQDEGDLFADLS